MRAIRQFRRILSIFCLTTFLAGLPFFASEAEDVNIAKGMDYVFATGQPTTHSYDRYSNEYDNDRGQLTNGVYAKLEPGSAGWLSSFRSASRTVTFDFGKTVTVTGMSADFLHDPTNYHAPREARLYLSDDGENWFLAGTVKPDFPISSSMRRYTPRLSVGPYAARFVRVEYTVDVFALCDEIEIYGETDRRADAKDVVPDPPEASYFCTSLGERTDITDIVKIYNGYYPADQSKADNTEEELLPYVGYIGKDGTVLDTLFDAVAFVPCVSTDFAYPSGGTLVRTNNFPSAVMSDWILYADYLFQEGKDLHALDRTVETVFSALNKGPSETYPVLLTMPYPAAASKPFGDLDGDGTQEYTRTVEERLAVVEWYDKYLTERFEQAGFRRLEFVGYYWYNETIDESWSEGERAFTEGMTQILRNAGKEVLFDPFYLSIGFDQWQDYGFTGAVMQPNLAFLKSRPYFEPEMLDEFAQTIASEHLGVEIETDEPSYFRADDITRPAQYYERYLYVGAMTGYMNALHTFYQGAGPGSLYDFSHATASTPSDVRLRRLYDITYQFVKGTYSNLPPEVTVPSELQTDAGERVRADISWTDGDSFPGDVTVTVSEPSNGTAQVALNRKTLIYRPNDGFEGTDLFFVSVSDGFCEPMTFPVRVTVGAGEPSGEEPSEAEISAGEEPGSGNAWYWILGIAAAAVIAACAVVIVLVFRKKPGPDSK